MVFRRLSDLAVHVANLAEAEGRELRRVVARLGLGFCILLVAAGLTLMGSSMILLAVWLGLAATPMGQAWASAITGAMAVALAGGALLWASKVYPK